MPHITQIAAIEPGSKSTFDSYSIPTIPISLEADNRHRKNRTNHYGYAQTAC